jgi:hypothetical protein
MFDRAYHLAELLLIRLERVIELLEQLLRERDHAGR